MQAPLPGYRPATSWVHYTTSCNTQSSAPDDGRDHRPKHVELIGIINKPLLLHLVGCLYYLWLSYHVHVQSAHLSPTFARSTNWTICRFPHKINPNLKPNWGSIWGTPCIMQRRVNSVRRSSEPCTIICEVTWLINTSHISNQRECLADSF